jgi:hypothetical protein
VVCVHFVTSCLLLMACTTSEARVCHSLMSSSLFPVYGEGKKREVQSAKTEVKKGGDITP